MGWGEARGWGRGEREKWAREEWEEEGWGEISIYREGVNNELGWGDGMVDLTSRDEIELSIEMEELTRERKRDKIQKGLWERVGEGRYKLKCWAQMSNWNKQGRE